MSKTKKPRNKKHNPHLRRKRALLADTAGMVTLMMTALGPHNHLMLIRTRQLVQPKPFIADAFARYPYRWSVYIAVFGRLQDGGNYMKGELIKTKQEYRYEELADLLNERHQELIRGFNDQHKIGAGYIASIHGRDWDEEEAFEIFEKHGAFNDLTVAEALKQQQDKQESAA